MKHPSARTFVKTYGVIQIAIWTAMIALVLSMTVYFHHYYTLKSAENEARDYYRLNLFYRAWGARLGGVYAPMDKVEPNPHLRVARRDVTTSDGQRLTLINPAYMTRMVFEAIKSSSSTPIISKLVSLKPLNPVNVPDPWERGALAAIERGEITERSEVTELNGTPYLRLISRFVTEEPCLKCHAAQGYRLGDIRGGISISIPLSGYYGAETKVRDNIIAGYFSLWLVGSAGIALYSRRRHFYEEELRASEGKLRVIFDVIQAGIVLVAPDGVITYANQRMAEMLGCTLVELVGSAYLSHVHPDDRSVSEGRMNQLIRREKDFVTEERHFLRADGSDFRGYVSGRLQTTPEGEAICFVGTIADVSELKAEEEKRRKLEQQMLHVQKLESLGVLAGGIAHDFNNILLSITGNASLALKRVSSGSPAEHHLRQIESAADKAADLARQMLAYSGKGRFVVEPVDLNQLVEEMTSMLEVSISKKAILRYHLTRPLPAIEADPTQIRQIVMNLTINASEAIGEKSGVISVFTGCMACDRKYLAETWLDKDLVEGLYVFLEVADTGCGMDRETIERIFEPFFTTKFTGRGLGMAAILGIVRGHKGAIKVYSEPGKGSTFKVLIPAGTRPPEIYNVSPEQDSWQGAGTILLVDDEETIRAIGSDMLRELGFDVVCAEDGEKALEIFRHKRDEISLVLLDLTMPHMSGDETFRELRRIDAQVRVVMSSGFSEQEVTQKFLGKGLSDFIQKPYTLQSLKEKLRRILG